MRGEVSNADTKSEKMDGKHIIWFMSTVWGGLSLFGGIKFINTYYAVGMSNSYCQQVGKIGQILSVIVAFCFALPFICSFVYKAFLILRMKEMFGFLAIF